jgi:predicted acylesterase/phospholipase RssA
MAAKQASVVLGGGGAKGFVHLGVLRAVVECGYDIVALYGTSIGSIIASLFTYRFADELRRNGGDRAGAQQEAVRRVTDLLIDTSFLRFADVSLSILQRGLLKGAKFHAWLETQLLAAAGTSSVRFRDFAAVLDLNVTFTDATTGDCVVASPSRSPDTLVSDAIRASMSMQGIFLEKTVDYNGRKIICWDGGVTGNCRYDLSCADHPEALTVASTVTYRGDPTALPNNLLTAGVRPLLLADRAADFWLRQIESLTFALLSDTAKQRLVVVRPDLGGVTTTSFFISAAKRRQLVENGFLAARRQLLEHEERD